MGTYIMDRMDNILNFLSPVVPAYPEITLSVLGFAAIQGVKRNQYLADLAPKDCFIAAKAVQRVVGQIG